jgi:hypothetical protein
MSDKDDPSMAVARRVWLVGWKVAGYRWMGKAGWTVKYVDKRGKAGEVSDLATLEELVRQEKEQER